MSQQVQADRDVYAAGRDQTVINDNRRVELAAGAVPHPAVVDLAGPVTGLPRRPVRVFEGRAEALGARGEAVVTQAVYGLGGVGKSELALQYATARRSDYGLVWWITSADAGHVDAGLAGLARRLCPVVTLAGTTADAAGWLQSHDQWLLILDNVEDLADIEPLLGQLGDGHVIVTSRRDTDWGSLADPVWLDVLGPEAAGEPAVARRRAGRPVRAQGHLPGRSSRVRSPRPDRGPRPQALRPPAGDRRPLVHRQQAAGRRAATRAAGRKQKRDHG